MDKALVSSTWIQRVYQSLTYKRPFLVCRTAARNGCTVEVVFLDCSDSVLFIVLCMGLCPPLVAAPWLIDHALWTFNLGTFAVCLGFLKVGVDLSLAVDARHQLDLLDLVPARHRFGFWVPLVPPVKWVVQHVLQMLLGIEMSLAVRHLAPAELAERVAPLPHHCHVLLCRFISGEYAIVVCAPCVWVIDDETAIDLM